MYNCIIHRKKDIIPTSEKAIKRWRPSSLMANFCWNNLELFTHTCFASESKLVAEQRKEICGASEVSEILY